MVDSDLVHDRVELPCVMWPCFSHTGCRSRAASDAPINFPRICASAFSSAAFAAVASALVCRANSRRKALKSPDSSESLTLFNHGYSAIVRNKLRSYSAAAPAAPMIGDNSIQTSRQRVTAASAGCPTSVVSCTMVKCASLAESASQVTPEGLPQSVRYRTIVAQLARKKRRAPLQANPPAAQLDDLPAGR